MSLKTFSVALLLVGITLPSLQGDEIPKEYQDAIKKGLTWMSRNQHKDGHWEATGGQYPITMTALGGMTMLMYHSRRPVP